MLKVSVIRKYYLVSKNTCHSIIRPKESGEGASDPVAVPALAPPPRPLPPDATDDDAGPEPPPHHVAHEYGTRVVVMVHDIVRPQIRL